MAGTVHAFEFLAGTPPSPFPPVCVLYGDEDFLKRLAQTRIRDSVQAGHPDAPFTTIDGEEGEWRDVFDEISTVSLFGGGAKRLVVVESADDFVSRFRAKLEDYIEHPRNSGVLVLNVGTWASNTRLYKAVDKLWLQIDCRLPQVGRRSDPDLPRIVSWLVERAKTEHQATLAPAAAKLLIELVGTNLGMLDQDIAKLALFIKGKEKITEQLVRDVVGGWKAQAIWDVIDAAANGDAAQALRQLDMALQSGEPPLALFGQISWSLRRYTVATRIYAAAERRGEKMPLREALLQAGFRPFPPDALPKAEKQLMQLGRDRAGRLLQWLLEADLAMKGSHSSPDRARFVLEKLFLRMAARPKARTVG